MLKKFIKFGIVGGLGTVTNLLIFYLLADILDFNPTVVSVLCFMIAGTQNYFLNHLWTFKIENISVSPSFVLWVKFMLASVCGLIVNILIMNLCLYIRDWSLKVIPQGIGILAGMVFNFLITNFIVFRKRK